MHRMRCLENDRVIVRIWTSSLNRTAPGEGVGHISIETFNYYMSLWPASQPGQAAPRFFEERPPHFMANYQGDFVAEENRAPERVFCLYSLDSKEMEKQFATLKSAISAWAITGSNNVSAALREYTKGWTIRGENVLTAGQYAKESCASLAYKILKAGGLYELISTMHSSSISIISTPDELARLMLLAKQEELSKCTETKDFSFAGETTVVTETKRSWCSVM